MIELVKFDAQPSLRTEQRLLAQQAATGTYVLVETCDRLELYRGSGLPSRSLLRYVAATSAGLLSPLIGEKAIQGQVKAAWLAAQKAGTLSSGLHQLFQQALGMGKRIREATGIDQGCMSHASAVYQIIKQHSLLAGPGSIILLGINDLTRSLLQYLQGKTAATVVIANRRREKALALSQEFAVSHAGLAELPALLADCAVLVCASSAPHYLVTPETFAVRKSTPLLICDLAAPPDVHPDCASFEGVTLLGLQAVEQTVSGQIARRQSCLNAAWAVLEHELDAWEASLRRRERFRELACRS